MFCVLNLLVIKDVPNVKQLPYPNQYIIKINYDLVKWIMTTYTSGV